MDNPNYYAIIPANVRYDKRLKANEKLLYGEITALTNKDGVCWATNNYFANLYDVSIVSVSTWIKNLIDCGYISSELIYNNDSKEILKRYLRILKDPLKENLKTPLKENLKDNTTSTNSTSTNSTRGINAQARVLFDYVGFDELEIKAIKDWLEYKKEKHQTYKQRGLIELKKKLLALKERGSVIDCISNCISNNWSGLFAQDNNKPKQNNNLKRCNSDFDIKGVF